MGQLMCCDNKSKKDKEDDELLQKFKKKTMEDTITLPIYNRSKEISNKNLINKRETSNIKTIKMTHEENQNNNINLIKQNVIDTSNSTKNISNINDIEKENNIENNNKNIENKKIIIKKWVLVSKAKSLKQVHPKLETQKNH